MTLLRWPSVLERSLSRINAVSGVQVALEAIFSTPDEDIDGGNFRKHEDHLGFDLVVVPHPGDAEANFVWADIKIRSGFFIMSCCNNLTMHGSCWKVPHPTNIRPAI